MQAAHPSWLIKHTEAQKSVVGVQTVPRQDQTTSERQAHMGCSSPCAFLHDFKPPHSLKFTAQLTFQPGCVCPLPRHLPTAKLWHCSTLKLLLVPFVYHTACPSCSVLWRASSCSSPSSSHKGQCWKGKPGFLHLSCFSLLIILYYIYILNRGLKRAGGMLLEPSTPPLLRMPGAVLWGRPAPSH